MPHRTLEIIEKECGCIVEMAEHDHDRTYMCYTETRTNYINKCDKHTQEEKEREEFDKLKRIRKGDERKKSIYWRLAISYIQHWFQ